MALSGKRKRSTLPRDTARKKYVEAGQLAVLQQIRRDAVLLDKGEIAIGPFARLDASAVAARDRKTRGVVTNLFGSQAAFQTETMAIALIASHLIEEVVYPPPADFPDADAWADAFFAAQAARGPQRGAKPAITYGFLWTLWLSAVPYGMWSNTVSRSSLEEHILWVKQLEGVLDAALAHFSMAMRSGVTLNDFATAVASLVEGTWLNQCLTDRHPSNPSQSIDIALRRSGLMLWRGATERPA